jgi:heavy metal translocating P-type ATPase
MLAEKHGPGDPGAFRESELFKKCQELGIVPKSEAEVGKKPGAEQKTPEAVPRGEERRLSLALKIKGMWCPACAWVIEEALRNKPGLLKAECSFSADRIRCDYDPILASPPAIMEALASLGYEAFPPEESIHSRERKREIVRFAISAFLTMNVMMISFGVYAGFLTELSGDAIRNLSWPIFVMATFVLLYGGKTIYRRALKGIVSAGFSMETLITMGVFTAYLYSTYQFFSGSIHLYYDTACMLIVLVLLGKFLESGAKARIQENLDHLFSSRPSKVRLLFPGSERGRYVSIEQLRRGDWFQVAEGEVVPADGKIVEGNAAVDESSLTGEARPMAKRPGDDLRSGVRVIHGSLKARAERIGDESTLGQMLGIIEKALRDETPFEGRIDRILRWFVPFVLVMAAGTGVVCLGIGLPMEEAIIRSMTVMVISCPCTLGIAIPLTRLAGISLAEKKGILVRDFSSFEKALEVDTFVFDKTGTVTEGQWKLRDILLTGSLTRQEVLAKAISIEEQSQHPIAAELKRRAEEASVSFLNATDVVVSAKGVRGKVQGHEVRIGSRDFMKKELETFERQRGPISFETEGQNSYVYMSTGGTLCAVFVFGDEIKKGSSETIQKLKGRGYRLSLISGDGNDTTRAIARRTGFEVAYGGKLPGEKAAFVKKLQSEKGCVAMVGDGMNDAPALAQADLGIAVHSGGSLAQEASDLTLMRGDLSQILDFLILAKGVSRKTRQNLIFAGLYNLIAIPVAMSGFLNPLIAVSAMLLSSLSVIGNTLLLIKRGD